MGAEQRSERDRQIEERLALLLRPGPRRVRSALVESRDGGPSDGGPSDGGPRDEGPSDEGRGEGATGQESRPSVTAERDDRPGDAETGGGGRADRGRTVAPRGSGFGSVRVPARWQFGRPQLLVVVAVVLIGVLLGGWAVLRAKPIAIASPHAATGGTTGVATAAASESRGRSPTAAASESATASAVPKIKVHVLGAVRSPGVVALAPQARVQDALAAAGGARRSAELGDLNLAQQLADGQQLFVSRDPDRTELREPGTSTTTGSIAGSTRSGAGGSGMTTAGAPQTKINLNTATLQELDQLPGVGPVTAQKILSWRDLHQRFTSVQELQEVDGIGPKTFADLEPLVTAP